MSPAAFQIAFVLLAGFCAGGLLLALLYPRLAGAANLDRRMRFIAADGLPSNRRDGVAEEGRRKRSVEETLREMADQQKAKAKKRSKVSLKVRMRQAGLNWTKNTYYVACLIAGLVSFALALTLIGAGLLTSLGFGVAGGLLLPHWYVNLKRNSRFKRFSAEFPNSVDVIVRGVKAGLPLIDCLKIIAAESQEPVKGEFKSIIEDQTVGMPLDEAVARLPQRMPLAEANFFAIVIAIQSRTGGSLSEALGNLSKVLRERKKMKSKIKAMSAEAKASAGIIGALPIIVALLVYVTSPDYIALLFTTAGGNMALVGSGIWMLIGIAVMRKMINFSF